MLSNLLAHPLPKHFNGVNVMGKTVQYSLTQGSIYRPTAEEWKCIDELAERMSESYYADIPEMDDEFLDKSSIIYSQNREQISVRLNSHTLSYFQRFGDDYEMHISAVLDAYVATKELEQSDHQES